MTPPKLTRSEQARINGAKSKGPISIEGKTRSSLNSLRHGFAAAINTVLSVEDVPAWELHLEGYRQSFLPLCYVEQTLVDHLASINWRQSRLVALETALIDAQITIQESDLRHTQPKNADNPYFHLVLAWQALARQPQSQSQKEPLDPTQAPEGYDIGSIELVRRYIVTLDRQYRNVLLNLRQYRKDFATPNEPEKQLPTPVEAPKATPVIIKTTQCNPGNFPNPINSQKPTLVHTNPNPNHQRTKQ